MPEAGRHAAPRATSVEADPESTQALERALLGRPATMGRREVSRGAGVSIRSARKFWHALGFPLVSEDDAMFTEADLAALQGVAELVRSGAVDEDFALAMTRALARTMDRLAIWQTQLVAEEIAAERGADLDQTGDEAADLAASPEVAKELSLIHI